MQTTDLRVVKTLKQIDQALLESLADTPFEKITVDQLCRAALINRSTFYKYYTSKFDLMDRYLQRALDGFRRQVDVAFVNATPDTVHSLVYQKNFETTLQFLHKHKDEYLLLWSIPREQNVFTQMVDIVYEAILEKLPASPAGPSPYADLYARLFASDMMTLVRWWFRYEGQISAKDVQNLMTKNMKQGMFRTFREQLRQQNPPTCQKNRAPKQIGVRFFCFLYAE